MNKLLLFIFLVITIQLQAQPIILRGLVKDAESNEPLAGAAISIKGKLLGTITDTKGNFSLSSTLQASFIIVISVVGYQRQEKKNPNHNTP